MAENVPDLVGSTGAVLLDGVPQELVTAFDEEAGWVEVLCTIDTEGPHPDPLDPTDVCRRRITGRVEYRP